ncbi:AmiS/UreI transporter [Salinibacterium sp. SYSU T00001]|uniref:AmiS/UreI family transporter n=1 Tax=Homoserinimonas sedimenticola TaxID=2986805 RepID=UPI002236185E|nr:AmiS/UreI family transporter [Salinibacterium sedimenticola]MCW4385509.1 AmiS/UreI transporter [Salinibacterium sedimenticola]
MSLICLILSGAALLINGLALLGRIPGRDSGFFNVLIGSTQLVLATLVAVAAGGNPAALLAVSGVFLFGLTYLYVGLNALLDLGSIGLGWFCGLVAALGLVYSGANLATDPVLSVLWLAWATLWTLFFLLLGLGWSRLTTFTAWSLILTSQLTTTVPALFGLTDNWPTGGTNAVIALLVIVALFAGAAGITAATSRRRAALPDALPTPA